MYTELVVEAIELPTNRKRTFYPIHPKWLTAELFHDNHVSNMSLTKLRDEVIAIRERRLDGAMDVEGLQGELSAREMYILQLIAYGKTNDEIALIAQISGNTVKNHATGIFTKLNCSNRMEAVRRAVVLGLVEFP